MSAPSTSGLTDRMGRTARFTWIVIVSILLLFSLAMLAGFTASFVEKPHLIFKRDGNNLIHKVSYYFYLNDFFMN